MGVGGIDNQDFTEIHSVCGPRCMRETYVALPIAALTPPNAIRALCSNSRTLTVPLRGAWAPTRAAGNETICHGRVAINVAQRLFTPTWGCTLA